GPGHGHRRIDPGPRAGGHPGGGMRVDIIETPELGDRSYVVSDGVGQRGGGPATGPGPAEPPGPVARRARSLPARPRPRSRAADLVVCGEKYFAHVNGVRPSGEEG